MLIVKTRFALRSKRIKKDTPVYLFCEYLGLIDVGGFMFVTIFKIDKAK